MNLFIVNRTGTVHRFPPATGRCQATDAPIRRAVTTLQALVFKLGHCTNCWLNIGDYERHIGRRTHE